MFKSIFYPSRFLFPDYHVTPVYTNEVLWMLLCVFPPQVAHYTSFPEMKSRDALLGAGADVFFNLDIVKKDGGFFRKGSVDIASVRNIMVADLIWFTYPVSCFIWCHFKLASKYECQDVSVKFSI